MSFNLFRHNINISMTKAIVKELRKEDKQQNKHLLTINVRTVIAVTTTEV